MGSKVPPGHVAVYVGRGDEKARSVIKIQTLTPTAFQAVLAKSAQEYGFSHTGGLIISCDVAIIEHILSLKGANPSPHYI